MSARVARPPALACRCASSPPDAGEGALHVDLRHNAAFASRLPVLIHWTRQMLWRLLAAASVLLGAIGAFLPVLPTVPFLLLAAWAAGRGWPALEAKLLAHPTYGPHIVHWRENGAVPRRAKWLASVMMLFSATTLWFSPVPPWLRGSVWLILVVVAGWLWTRPEPAGDD